MTRKQAGCPWAVRRIACFARAMSLALVLFVPRVRWPGTRARSGGHARFLALNVAIGATASMARALASGTPLRDALVKGLLGGSLRRRHELVGTESRRTFAGLQLTAVGTSVARTPTRVPRCSPTSRCRSTRCTFAAATDDRPVTARLSVMRRTTRIGDDERVAPASTGRRSPRRAGVALAKVAPAVIELSTPCRSVRAA